ncbi:MAG: hypothetical protein AB7O80_23235 [Acetobacteraceae bacterium]
MKPGISIVLMALMAPALAQARVLEVGAGRPYAVPSAAAAHAYPGDTIRIAAGTYEDCMVINADRVTIEGEGPDTVLANRTCQGKGILVISGKDVTVRTLVLRGARVEDRNGAGIRAQGGNLTVEAVQFIDNENGILAAPNPAATIRIRDSAFIGNGKCEPVCAHGVYIGQIGLLRIERTRFADTRRGHHIKSRAGRTEIVESDISDGPTGTASYLIDIPNGGDVLVERSRLMKGPNAENPTGAIMIGMEGATNPSLYLRVTGNEFTNGMTRPTNFVVNRTRTAAVLTGNKLTGDVRPLEGPGTVK